MRSERLLSSLALAALAALGLPLGAAAQVAAAARGPQASLTGCAWQPVGSFPHLLPRALTTTPDGALLLAGEDTADSLGSVAVTLRLPPGGGSWQEVDRYSPAGATQTGIRALHVDDDGNVFLLAWEQRATDSRLVLRRSFGGGTAGTWESAETSWPLSPAGALGSDAAGRIYVAYSADVSGVGWRVESALRGMGAFTLDDEVRFAGSYAALPQDLERTADGTLLLAGQLDGAPDEWVVRARPLRADGRPAAWRTIDRYRLTADAYGLAPRAVVATRDGRLLVAGLGVRGGGSDDYQWLERWRNARGRWRTSAYQLSQGLTSLGLDAAPTPGGVAVLGMGLTSTAANLVLRETTDAGAHWQTVLALDGVTDPWSLRLAVGPRVAAVTAVIRGVGVVVGCPR